MKAKTVMEQYDMIKGLCGEDEDLIQEVVLKLLTNPAEDILSMQQVQKVICDISKEKDKDKKCIDIDIKQDHIMYKFDDILNNEFYDVLCDAMLNLEPLEFYIVEQYIFDKKPADVLISELLLDMNTFNEILSNIIKKLKITKLCEFINRSDYFYNISAEALHDKVNIMAPDISLGGEVITKGNIYTEQNVLKMKKFTEKMVELKNSYCYQVRYAFIFENIFAYIIQNRFSIPMSLLNDIDIDNINLFDIANILQSITLLYQYDYRLSRYAIDLLNCISSHIGEKYPYVPVTYMGETMCLIYHKKFNFSIYKSYNGSNDLKYVTAITNLVADLFIKKYDTNK